MKHLKRASTRNEFGLLTLKASVITAATALATVSVGTAIAAQMIIPAGVETSSNTGIGICVTAKLAEDPSIFATRGNCVTDQTPGEAIPDPPDTPQNRMVTTWNTNLAPNCQQIDLPISDLKGTVDWNDETTNSSISHNFETNPGLVKITIDGEFPDWGGEDWITIPGEESEQADSNCIVSVDSWGETGTTSLSYAFSGAINLEHVEKIPSTTTDLSHAFALYSSLPETGHHLTLGSWDTSNVISMSWMFFNSQVPDEALNFDTSNVKDMSFMFANRGAVSNFNTPLNFDTKNVENMEYMLHGNTSFDQAVNFNTSNVKNMSGMFSSATSFNQPLNFETAKVEDMYGMFQGANSFDQDISHWKTQNVLSMRYMFQDATSFNKPLNLDTSSVNNMTGMFEGARSFDQPLNFNTKNVTNIEYMFHEASAFNQDLSSWDTSGIKSAYYIEDYDLDATSWTKPRPIFTEFIQ